MVLTATPNCAAYGGASSFRFVLLVSVKKYDGHYSLSISRNRTTESLANFRETHASQRPTAVIPYTVERPRLYRNYNRTAVVRTGCSHENVWLYPFTARKMQYNLSRNSRARRVSNLTLKLSQKWHHNDSWLIHWRKLLAAVSLAFVLGRPFRAVSYVIKPAIINSQVKRIGP